MLKIIILLMVAFVNRLLLENFELKFDLIPDFFMCFFTFSFTFLFVCSISFTVIFFLHRQPAFQRDIIWNLDDISMLVGSNMQIFGGGRFPVVSLRLRLVKMLRYVQDAI